VRGSARCERRGVRWFSDLICAAQCTHAMLVAHIAARTNREPLLANSKGDCQIPTSLIYAQKRQNKFVLCTSDGLSCAPKWCAQFIDLGGERFSEKSSSFSVSTKRQYHPMCLVSSYSLVKLVTGKVATD